MEKPSSLDWTNSIGIRSPPLHTCKHFGEDFVIRGYIQNPGNGTHSPTSFHKASYVFFRKMTRIICARKVKIILVMKMKDSKDILSSLLKTTQMGQVGIRSVEKAVEGNELKKALRSQLREYDKIEQETYALAKQRGWELAELNPMARTMADMATRGKLMYNKNDSRIAEMMVQGNTRGVIKSLKNLHRYHQNDAQVTAMAEKLLNCENNNIKQMEGFL
jgi:hypothetical protein